MPKVLIGDTLSPAAVEIFKARGIETDIKVGLSKEDLIKIIGDYDGLAVRSACKPDADVIAAATNLKVIGRAGIGVDNIDIKAATAKGVVVMDTPFGNAITTAEVLQELIKLAQDIRAARNRGEEQGLSDEEIAFYDALAENESALQVMGDDKLRVIAHELLVSLRKNVAVDWAHRESARARLRVLVKRILRKYGYPPDLQDAAVQTVLQQAEVLSASWQPGHARA